MPYFSIGSRDHPRIRGEHRILPPGQTLPGGSSPHTRGAHPASSTTTASSWIIPAYAGSTSALRSSTRVLADHPRIRGEHKSAPTGHTPRPGSSPHTRGAHDARRDHGRHLRIIPAYAGSTRASPCPRAARGRIIPAYAGSTCRRPPSPGSWPDHPRIRGEHFNAFSRHRQATGSSPHTRGARKAQVRYSQQHRIIPAYAGSTRRRASASPRTADHPRIRGEHVDVPEQPDERLGSSPHTRGARDGAIASDPGPGDHPRIRGEHNLAKRTGLPSKGSSPHTRGARSSAGCR